MASKIGNNVFGLQALLKEGTKHLQGQEEAVNRNIAAVLQTAELTMSSYGPLGLSKLIINAHDKLILTNNAGVILREVGVDHPAARMLLLAAEQQKREWGDGSGWVCVMTGEWLRLADGLLRQGLVPSQIVDGFEVAGAQALDILADLRSTSADLAGLIRAQLASKQYGHEAFLSHLVLQAYHHVTRNGGSRFSSFNTDNVRIVKVMGGCLEESVCFPGMLFNRDAEGAIKAISSAPDADDGDASSAGIKVAVFACPIGTLRTETKGTVLFTKAEEMLAFNRDEEAALKHQIAGIAAAGVRCLVTNDTVSDAALHICNEAHVMVVRIPGKWDYRRLCRTLGATAIVRFDFQVNPEHFGSASSVESVEIGADRCIVFKSVQHGGGDKGKQGHVATIVLRGSSPNHLDDLERAIDDALMTLKVVSSNVSARRSPAMCDAGNDNLVSFDVLPGAGATEVEVSRRLQAFAQQCPGVAQLAMRRFAEGFERIPVVLATNAGLNGQAVLGKLLQNSLSGVNIALNDGGMNDSDDDNCLLKDPIVKHGIMDHYETKVAALKHALQATLTILRIDQIIMSKPPPQGAPAPRAPSMMDE